jgi:hypothetical protein
MVILVVTAIRDSHGIPWDKSHLIFRIFFYPIPDNWDPMGSQTFNLSILGMRIDWHLNFDQSQIYQISVKTIFQTATEWRNMFK